MKQQHEEQAVRSDFNRRDFLKGSSVATLMAMMGGIPLKAEDKPTEDATAPSQKGNPVNCAVIGCGSRGRDILNTLARLPNGPVVAICDTYPLFLRRAKESAPKAEAFEDYRKVLDQKEVKAVLVATPSHQHTEIAVAALQAGKHVYCEAPLATSIEDARTIARAARAAGKQYFQAGLDLRSNPQRHFLLGFIRSGAIGKTVMARSQWNQKKSWRLHSPNPDREKEINWRLRQESSLGLIGEIGLHQVDAMNWFLNARPVAVTGLGGIMLHNDGRDVPDTVQAVFEYPGGVRLIYHATLANSFDGEYDILYGTDSAVMIRQDKAWLFKEVDAPLLGWEVYARKDAFYKETGIALVANASKSTGTEANPDDAASVTNSPIYFALEAFLTNTDLVHGAVEDFIANFGAADSNALNEYLADLSKKKLHAAGYREGFEATVTAIKAKEAIVKGQKVAFQKEWFELG